VLCNELYQGKQAFLSVWGVLVVVPLVRKSDSFPPMYETSEQEVLTVIVSFSEVICCLRYERVNLL
jgi:hypothetical protein